jgi:hypothetical protein
LARLVLPLEQVKLPPVESLQTLGFGHGGQQVGRVDGFEQVVEGAELESLKGKLVVGRHEDHAEGNVFELFQQLKAVQFGHLNVEKHHVRL